MFDYKDHKCRIEYDREDDNVKTWFIVKKPNGQEVYADINPYNDDEELMKMWIDLDYPQRTGRAPLDRNDLLCLMENRTIYQREKCQS